MRKTAQRFNSPIRFLLRLAFSLALGLLTSSGIDAFPITEQNVSEMMKSGGVERRQAIWYVYQMRYDGLLRDAAEFLFQSGDYDDHRAILHVFDAYGESLENHLPDWYLFLDRYMNESLPVDILKECFRLMVKWQEHRLMHALARFAYHPLMEVRLAAYEAMSQMKNDILIPVILGMISSERPIYKMYALEGASHYPDRRLEPFMSRLLTDNNKSVRIYAIDAVSVMPNGSDKIVRMFTFDRNEEIRERVVESVAKNSWRQQIYIVQKALADPSPLVRRSALNAIDSLRDGFSAPYISRQLVVETEPDIKGLSLDVLMRLGKGGGGKGLSRILVEEESENLRLKGALTIGVTREYEASDALAHALVHDPSYRVRLESAYAMGRIKNARFRQTLRDVALNANENHDVRTQAILSLVEINVQEAIEFLESNLDSFAEAELKRQAEAILAKLREED
jgi:HEAT repeat protein